MRRPIVLLTVVASLTLTAVVACDKSVVAPITVAGTTFATSLGINLASYTALPSGVYYRDITSGTGTAADSGLRLSVRYTGVLKNGTQFDANTTNLSAFQFKLGVGEVIAGWDLGLKGMKVGGRRSLLIPPSQGYGNAGSGAVPGNAVMVFTVDLVSIP